MLSWTSGSLTVSSSPWSVEVSEVALAVANDSLVSVGVKGGRTRGAASVTGSSLTLSVGTGSLLVLMSTARGELIAVVGAVVVGELRSSETRGNEMCESGTESVVERGSLR